MRRGTRRARILNVRIFTKLYELKDSVVGRAAERLKGCLPRPHLPKAVPGEPSTNSERWRL